MKKGLLLLITSITILILTSCGSIQKSAIGSIADMLASPDGAGAFTSDDDPQLIADALPLALKIYEILMGLDEENADLVAVTGQNFILYSAAFVQMPADMTDDEDWEAAVEGRKRAKKLFRRGRDYIMTALEMRHEGFTDTLASGDYDAAMAMLDENDAAAIYWAGSGWLGMASTDPFDFQLTTTLDQAILLLYRSLELDPSAANIHGMMIRVQLSLPGSILVNMRDRSPAIASFMDDYYAAAGVDEDPGNRALYHYYRSLTLSEGGDPSPHVTMATAVSVKEQDVEGFKRYLDEALKVDPEAFPDDKLMIIIYQDRARWLLEHIEDYFLL